MVAARNSRWKKYARVLRGTVGWASFLGMFGVAGGLEQDTISLGAALVALPVLGGLMLWSVDQFIRDIQ